MKRMKCKGEALTADEIGVLQSIAQSGAPYKDLARDLDMSTTSIGVALYRISRKLDIRRRHSLTLYAYQHGLVDPLSIKIVSSEGR